MIGRRIESESGPPLGAIVWFLLAGLTAACAVFHPYWLIAAILPASMGVAFLLTRPRRFVAKVAESGLVLGDDPDGGEWIAYDSIQGLVGEGRSKLPGMPGPRRFAIRIAHPKGVVRVPKRLNVDSEELFRFLAEQVPDRGVRPIHHALEEYRDKMAAAFGADQVWTFGAAGHLAARSSLTRIRAGSLAAVVAGLAWLAIGLGLGADHGKPGAAWAGGGLFLVLCGSFLFALSYAGGADRTASLIKKWRESSLVISPAGLALAQGDILGEVTWGELKGVRFADRGRSRSFQMTREGALPGIELKVAGASIVIADVYERPLFVLHDHIDRYRQNTGRPVPTPDIPEL
jgi:hypothetical protein